MCLCHSPGSERHADTTPDGFRSVAITTSPLTHHARRLPCHATTVVELLACLPHCPWMADVRLPAPSPPKDEEPPGRYLFSRGFVSSTRMESESGQCGRVQESHSDLMEPVSNCYMEAASPRQMTASSANPQKHPIYGRGTKPGGLHRNMTLVHLEQRRC
ncbi:unnamed protein product [Pleuronectes platessa]|uniref:Uncharacterized protein n=1 Tax=Pleuronectes platessa TaxID=8262 RepID=A0A9N7VK35_PLEPL|nr:unnamed protein product [Pleuronectes platessa]